jgi:multicomponent K+:H+ antiporter subunit E
VKRLLPHPIVSFFVALVWLGLHSSIAPFHLAVAAALAIAVPHALGALLDDPVRIARPLAAARLALVVLWDIVVANLAVARLVLGPTARLRPGFVRVPLDASHPDLVALLASIVTMTPGTVSADVDEARSRLLVHVLDLADEAAVVATIKRRYEAPLKEIFGC